MTYKTNTCKFKISRLLPLGEKQYMRFPVSFRSFARWKKQWIPLCAVDLETTDVYDEQTLVKFLFTHYGEGVWAGFGYKLSTNKYSPMPVCLTRCKFIVEVIGYDVDNARGIWEINRMSDYWFWHTWKYKKWDSPELSRSGRYNIQKRNVGAGFFRF